jgi:hypothetical protein
MKNFSIATPCRLIVALIIFCSNISGCAQYQQATGPNSVKLTIENVSNGNYANLVTWSDPDECQNGQDINIGTGVSYKKNTLQPLNAADISIEAGKKFSIGYTTSTKSPLPGFYKYCYVAGIFTPEKGKSYVAHLAPTEQGCSIKIFEEKKGNKEQRPVPFRFVRFIPSTLTAPSMCVDY